MRANLFLAMRRNVGGFVSAGEEVVLLISALPVLVQCYRSVNNEQQRSSVLILVMVAVSSCVLEKCRVPIQVPPSLKRDSSAGLFYGLFLIPAILLQVSLQLQAQHMDPNFIYSVCENQILISLWLILYIFWSWCFRAETAITKFDAKSLTFMCLTGPAMYFLSNSPVRFAVQAVACLGSIKVSALYLSKCFTLGELLLLVNLATPLLFNYNALYSQIPVSLVTNQVLYFVSLFLLSLSFPLSTGCMSPWFFYSSGILLLTILLYILFASLPDGFVLWMVHFILDKFPSRQWLLVVWVAEILFCAFYVALFRSSTVKSSSSERKLFHILMLVTFVPGLMCDLSVLFFCSVGAVCILLILEAVRILQIPPFSHVLNERYSVFLDPQDKGCLILTPIYLLLGQSLPIWATCLQNSSLLHVEGGIIPVAAYSGVLSVGIGDTAAAVMGSRFGTHKWPGSRKTIEGTLSAIAFQCLFILSISKHLNCSNVFPGVMAAIAISLIEAFTVQIDNIVLPVYMYFLLNAPAQ